LPPLKRYGDRSRHGFIIAIRVITRYLPDGRQLLPWDYFRVWIGLSDSSIWQSAGTNKIVFVLSLIPLYLPFHYCVC